MELASEPESVNSNFRETLLQTIKWGAIEGILKVDL